MNLIFDLTSLAAQAAKRTAPLGGVQAPPEVRQPATEPQNEPQPKPPVYDEYSPAEKPEPIGQYWLGQDEEGQPKVYFDEPKADEENADKAAASDKKSGGKKAEKCIGSTDKVDREIERLKKRREALKQQLAVATDESKIKNLQNKLKQVESELARKDNDTYRRSHTQVSEA